MDITDPKAFENLARWHQSSKVLRNRIVLDTSMDHLTSQWRDEALKEFFKKEGKSDARTEFVNIGKEKINEAVEKCVAREYFKKYSDQRLDKVREAIRKGIQKGLSDEFVGILQPIDDAKKKKASQAIEDFIASKVRKEMVDIEKIVKHPEKKALWISNHVKEFPDLAEKCVQEMVILINKDFYVDVKVGATHDPKPLRQKARERGLRKWMRKNNSQIVVASESSIGYSEALKGLSAAYKAMEQVNAEDPDFFKEGSLEKLDLCRGLMKAQRIDNKESLGNANKTDVQSEFAINYYSGMALLDTIQLDVCTIHPDLDPYVGMFLTMIHEIDHVRHPEGLPIKPEGMVFTNDTTQITMQEATDHGVSRTYGFTNLKELTAVEAESQHHPENLRLTQDNPKKEKLSQAYTDESEKVIKGIPTFPARTDAKSKTSSQHSPKKNDRSSGKA